ncbi:F-box-like domain superfamily [Arabidopsis thaliana x Arabidopsis arenosa]|uniref:F-box-like domain superfamily n=1 Tax=Arabidopsis thaliana x Arabidopsis arenosa TaxID=1240361 RepID=A0A8T1ZPN8_9BRAS|nr:F-box-like domain superfamily [Arabidopsis thaliana x Arabidopsis arenosa]
MVLPELYEELLIEILIRLPMNSLMRFKCVSKHWLFMITSRYLTNLFYKSCSSRRSFFAYLVIREKQSNYALLTTSSSHDDHSVSVIDQDLTMPIMGGYFLNACRGLVCFTVGSRVQICNLNTRQLVELPIILTPQGGEDYNIWYYFGHDPVHDEYKVLSFIWRHNREEWKVRSEHHVLVLGAGASWKKTQCHIHHLPYCQGITINGVLYYGAWTDDKKCVLMSFDFSSEEFNLIELPYKVGFLQRSPWPSLMNYNGKIAVFDYVTIFSDCSVRVWVIEDVNKSQWSHKKTFVLPTDFAHKYDFVMGGTGHSGKIWLRKENLSWNQPTHFFIYDLVGNEITRKIEISPSLLGSFKQTDLLLPTLWDDTESIMYLET